MKDDMKILSGILSSGDVRRLPEEQLPELAREARETILKTAAENGGHFASNLGAVELTVALHRCFSVPEERIVFDVGHQAYTHKLLTGRYGDFSTLRRYGGLSGFTNREESSSDAVTAGHSGSALSLAVGMAEGERLRGSGNWTAAVIGDGSFTNGMVFEALNALSESKEKLRLCVVLNDNEMSISKNVGGLSRHLAAIRTSRKYFNFKLFLKRFFSGVPLVGSGLVRGARAVRDFVKRTTGAETFFEKLGLEYIGPVDGHDIRRLIHVFGEAKSKDCPVIVHVVTKKGRGYPDAEAHPERYHSPGPFDLETGAPPAVPRGFAAALSSALCELAEKDPKITAVTAAMTDGCGLAEFASRFPDRFFDVGIAEEHAAAMAGGMALSGLSPFVVMYSTFSQRIFDQLWHDVALQKARITLCLSHAGIVPGDGVTHQGIYDAALFARIPGVTVRSPMTPEELPEVLRRTEGDPGISVVRYPKGGGDSGEIPGDWKIRGGGSWKWAQFGPPEIPPAAVLLTCGRIGANAARAAKRTAEERSVPVKVAVLTQIVPLPEDGEFRALCLEARLLLFAEEGIRSGGIAEALAAADWMAGKPVRIRAIEEGFLPHGTVEELEKRLGLDERSLADWLGAEIESIDPDISNP